LLVGGRLPLSPQSPRQSLRGRDRPRQAGALGPSRPAPLRDPAGLVGRLCRPVGASEGCQGPYHRDGQGRAGGGEARIRLLSLRVASRAGATVAGPPFTEILSESAYRRLWISGFCVNTARWMDLVVLG